MDCGRVSPLSGSAAVTAVTEKTAVTPPLFDKAELPEKMLQGLLKVQDLHALKGFDGELIAPGVTLYSLIPAHSGQPWTVELFDISEPLEPKYHKVQTKMLFVLEGTATVTIDAQEEKLLPGHSVRIFPGSTYSLAPVGITGCRFITLNLLGSTSDDEFLAKPIKTAPHLEPKSDPTAKASSIYLDPSLLSCAEQASMRQMKPLRKEDFKKSDFPGQNAAFDLIPGEAVGDRYNIAFQQIRTAKYHSHEEETERRFVLCGTLIAQLNNHLHELQIGQMCRISPKVAHKFSSANPDSPVTLFSINIPAYNPKDVTLLEETPSAAKK